MAPLGHIRICGACAYKDLHGLIQIKKANSSYYRRLCVADKAVLLISAFTDQYFRCRNRRRWI